MDDDMAKFEEYCRNVLHMLDALEAGTRHIISSISIGAVNIASGKMFDVFDAYIDMELERMDLAAKEHPEFARELYQLREIFEKRAALKQAELFNELVARRRECRPGLPILQ